MKNVLRQVAQFQLVYNKDTGTYYIHNTITGEVSYDIDFERVNILKVLEKFSFSRSCIQHAGNNLVKKIQ